MPRCIVKEIYEKKICNSSILTLALSACDDKGKKIDFPEMKEYSLTEGAGEHVADVPYDEYLKTPAFTDDMYTKE